MKSLTDMPLADKGLISYRYEGRYGWIMIGATDDKDALNEASRSTDMPIVSEKLWKWNGEKYEKVA